MDKKIQILLGSQKNINSVNVDTYDKIELHNNVSELMEYDVNDAVNASEVFDDERESTPIYRIYGKIEYLSMLNGLRNNYSILSDFFSPQYSGNSKNVLNSFDFYLVKPAESGYTQVLGSTQYIRYFKVIATPSDFELYPVGYSNNVYGEQAYAFSFKRDFDASEYFNDFDFPTTELFLYAQYKLKRNGNGIDETMKFNNWNSSGFIGKSTFNPTTLNIGDYVKTLNDTKICDLIDYQKNEFTQAQLSASTVYITTQYKNSLNQSLNLVWYFNPFTPFRLRYLASDLSSANTGSTSYDLVQSIPDYATMIDSDGNCVWREIVPQGYTEPLTGLGVDYPFFNKRRYLFSTIVFSIMPDLTDANTLNAFNYIWYSRNSTNLNITPNDDLSNIGKPCR